MTDPALAAEVARRLARGAADGLLTCGSDDDPGLYRGRAGVALALREAAADLHDERYADAADRMTGGLAGTSADEHGCSLYFGLTGVAVAQRVAGDEAAARRSLRLVRDRFDGERWGPMTELLAGNAGVALGALACGDVELAVTAVTPYVGWADPTAGGVSWPVRPTPARSHHVAHGTLGIVLALAATAQAAGRPDLLELALRGAADVVARDEAGPDGFLVPHSDPPHRPDVVERYSYGWCNGPAGDAQVFRLLERLTGDALWGRLQDRCWHTVTTSGLPARARPGFWDNQGRCCGTAGVLALALDRVAERGDDPAFADRLVADLASRALVDDTGVRWSNHEHRATPPDLPPEPGWAMGAAGILRELLRYARVRRGGPAGYAVAWPDHPPVVG